jgi:secondary thiamine-phosphate synthase enzyme
MAVFTKKIHLRSKGETDILDITEVVKKRLEECNLNSGIVTIFVPGATGGVTTLEYEPGLVKDLQDLFERIASKKLDYAHHKRWKDMNGYSHVRASLLGPSLAVPFTRKKLQLGVYQQIVFIDFDNRPRTREIILQIMGE